MNRATKRYLAPSITLILVTAAAYLIWAGSHEPQEVPENTPVGVIVGSLAYDLEFTSLNGETLRLSEYRGRLLILDFMAPWCGPCREQIKVLREVYAPGVAVISINVDPTYNSTYLQAFSERERLNWPMVSSPLAAQNYKVTAIPLILFIDKEGIIRYRGYYTTHIQFEQLITRYG